MAFSRHVGGNTFGRAYTSSAMQDVTAVDLNALGLAPDLKGKIILADRSQVA